MKGTLGPLAFLLTGLAWLVLSALLGFALYIGLVRSTSLPASLRLIHVHAALVGGLLQMLIGALLHWLPPALPSGRQRPSSRPGLYLLLNLGTLGMLVGFWLSQRTTVGIAGLFTLVPVLVLLSDAMRLTKHQQGLVPSPSLYYGLSLAGLLLGVGGGAAICFGLIPAALVALVRFGHIQLTLSLFVVVTLVGLTLCLAPGLMKYAGHDRLSRLCSALFLGGMAVLLAGFAMALVPLQVAAGTILLIGALLYLWSMVRLWRAAGEPRHAAADQLVLASCFLLLAIVGGLLVSLNSLGEQPVVPFGTLHLVAYTHLAFIGFFAQTLFAGLMVLLPEILASRRLASAKKRGPYLASLSLVTERWHALQVAALCLGTLGLMLVASLTWRYALADAMVQQAMWIAIGLLLFSLTILTVKVGLLLGHRPAA
ncbi:MAG TPA: hypothetical protein VLA99_01135 [Nitrospiraceae bacterium]|nr:hypothetical protein [Nitrospiraceae bacterium]